MVVQTLYILALFLGLSLVLGLLVAVHDSIERLVARRVGTSRAQTPGDGLLRGPGSGFGMEQASPAARSANLTNRRSQLPAGPATSARRDRQTVAAGLRDSPARLEAAERDGVVRSVTRR